MQIIMEELEPIVTATETARAQPSIAPRESVRREEDPHILRRLDRVAKVCAERMRAIDRSLFLLGRGVSRLIRHYDRERGLTALARRITNHCCKTVSRQYLGHALRVFESYSQDESENRFSGLTNTHLLKAAQGFPDADERDVRNDLLDDAAREKLTVSELLRRIKCHKAAHLAAKSSQPTSVTRVEEPRGYMCGNGLTQLQALSTRSVSSLRVRESIVAADAILTARDVLSDDGLMIVEQGKLDGYIDVSNAVNQAAPLRVLHAMIVLTSSTHRNASHDLPISDNFRIVVLVGRVGFRLSRSHKDGISNPMSESAANELIYSLVPDSGCVVDVGSGSIATAKWAQDQRREYLAVEPDASVYRKEVPDLETCSPPRTTEEPSTPTDTDLWPMVTESVRERTSIDGASWAALSCCERTQIAAVVAGVPTMVCPGCGNKQTAKLGARRC